MSWIQNLQVNSSQYKNHFPVILWYNMPSFMVWQRKEANLRFSWVSYDSTLIWSQHSYLFWVMHALWHFESSHYGLDVTIIAQISHCAIAGNAAWDKTFELGLPSNTEKLIPLLLDTDTSRCTRSPCMQMGFSHTSPMATHVCNTFFTAQVWPMS